MKTRLPDATREDMLRGARLPLGDQFAGMGGYDSGAGEDSDDYEIQQDYLDGRPSLGAAKYRTGKAGAVVGEEYGFLAEGGWSAVEIGSAFDGGITAHRGVLHPDEYVDPELLRTMIEQHLGFTYEEISSVYRQGRLSPDQRELRATIDAQMLALSRAGGNLTALADDLGIPLRTIHNAIARARG